MIDSSFVHTGVKASGTKRSTVVPLPLRSSSEIDSPVVASSSKPGAAWPTSTDI
jgi:hypothetical protein